ncbi:hypothetical protein G6R40_00235 [Chryseobacterium sp. POL2]|uniref:hypothetical protein n=1 Tax=Chryseobacterium sp. POL2 TaxID=2713414 RepID=UPI0013E1953C|nr:hypothetical protein [Chryseobacterium sp. POL2]QIG88178.1 hypothetical protein G6R40_00235 [Chryseobacterium sp. POL2]
MSTTHNSCDTLNETITKTQIERVVEGRKTFVSMVKELNACLSFCKDMGDSLQVPNDIILKIGYRFFFFGSFSQLINEDEYKIFIKECRAKLKDERKEHKETFGGKKDFDLNSGKIDLHIKYAPFTGHESRLAHYYRHLYTNVRREALYIDNKDISDEIESYSFEGNKCVVVYKNSVKAYSYPQHRIKMVRFAIQSKRAGNIFYYLKAIAESVGLKTEECNNIFANSYG